MNDTCPKHDDCLGRIHTAINSINISNAEMRGSVNSFMDVVTKLIDKMDKDVYDPEKGLGSKVLSHGTQLVLQWGLLSAILVGMIVIFFKK